MSKKQTKSPTSNESKKVSVVNYNYDVAKVLETRKLASDAVSFEFGNKTVKGAQFEKLVKLFIEIIPGKLDYHILFDSLRNLIGVRLTQPLIDYTCWRIAGNYKRLKQKRIVPVWNMQRLPEWVNGQIISCKRERNSKNKLGATFGFRILTGTPAGLITYKWWSTRMCRYLSPEFGFSKSRGKREVRFPYSSPEQLVGMRLYMMIIKGTKEPTFNDIGLPASLRKWNVETVKSRFRVLPGFTCAMELPVSQLPCHGCPVGFMTCRAACHRLDWVEKHCNECKSEAYFDTESQSNVCINCTIRAVYKPKA